MTNLIDLCARQRIKRLFGDRPTVSDAPFSAVPPADRAHQAPLERARLRHDDGKGRELAPIYSGADATPCDT